MSGKKIIGEGSTENKVIRLADHVAGLDVAGGGGEPRFIESGVIGRVNFENVGHQDGIDRSFVSLLTGGEHYNTVLNGENPVFEQALSANEVFYTGFDSVGDYLAFAKSEMGEALAVDRDELGQRFVPRMRYLLNCDFNLETSIKVEDLEGEKPLFSIGVCLAHTRIHPRGNIVNHLHKIADLPCFALENIDGFLELSGSGCSVVNIRMVDLAADPEAVNNSKPMAFDGFAGLALTIEINFKSGGALSWQTKQEMKKNATVRGEPLVFGDAWGDRNYFKAAVMGPEINKRYMS